MGTWSEKGWEPLIYTNGDKYSAVLVRGQEHRVSKLQLKAQQTINGYM